MLAVRADSALKVHQVNKVQLVHQVLMAEMVNEVKTEIEVFKVNLVTLVSKAEKV